MNRHWLARCHHQGLDTQLLQRSPPPVRSDADVQRRGRLGGLLSFYYREAASVVGPLLAPYAVQEFYEARSAIVHNPKRKAVTPRQHDAFAKGFDIARRSLFKLLREEPPDDWDALVVGGS